MMIPEVQRVDSRLGYEIELITVSSRAHACRDWAVMPRVSRRICTDFLVVGAGLAGLAAAYRLRQHDYRVCEVSQYIGGSSARGSFEGIDFGRGAHYEEELPDISAARLLDC